MPPTVPGVNFALVPPATSPRSTGKMNATPKIISTVRKLKGARAMG
jgi:hypothetical protein